MAAVIDLLECFDEATYLRANPDVAAAVGPGGPASGLQHFLLHGFREGRSGAPAGLAAAIAAWIDSGELGEWPPDELRERVHGDRDLANFAWLGRRITIDLLVALHAHGLVDSVRQPTLDFGVGCGRVARFWAALGGGALTGTDIDPETVGWCGVHLCGRGDGQSVFVTNQHDPPTSAPDGVFGLVYAISVFTHLPEEMEHRWITELARVTKPGGVLLLTTHGVDLWDGSSGEASESGFVYSRAGGAAGLPDFYRTSFHTEHAVRQRWGAALEIVAIEGKGVNDHQDLVVARRPSPGLPDLIGSAPTSASSSS